MCHRGWDVLDTLCHTGPGVPFSPSGASPVLVPAAGPEEPWGGGGWEETQFRAVGKKRGVNG